MEEKPSESLHWFWTFVSLSCMSMLAMGFFESEMIHWILFLIGFLFMLRAMTIRCSNCGVLIYRYDSKFHGAPSSRLLFQAGKCPNCGVKRIW